jgi:hypothetical protein
MVVYGCNPSYIGISRKIMVLEWPGRKQETPSEKKNAKAKKGWWCDSSVKSNCLAKCKALSSTLTTTKGKKKKKKARKK